MKREFSAGGVVFQKRSAVDGQQSVEWLIIKPRPSEMFPSHRYQLPKGHIEKGEEIEEAALREVFEETGIKAGIICKIETVKYPLMIGTEKIFKFVTYFLMEYVSGKPKINGEVEEILWLPFEGAKNKLTYSNDKAVLQKASELLN